MKQQELAEVLRDLGFCEDVEDEFVDQLAGVSKSVRFDPGQVVFREGEAARDFYLICNGHVALEICAPGVGCKRVMTLGAGDLLGWSAILKGGQLTATARALEVTEAIELSAPQVLTVCEHSPRFGYEFMRRAALALAKRLSATRLQLLNVYGHGMPAAPSESG